MLTPTVLDVILAAVGAEAVLLTLWLRSAGHRKLVAPALMFLGSGALLLLALRGALVGLDDAALAGLLLVGGVLHALCLRLVASALKPGSAA